MTRKKMLSSLTAITIALGASPISIISSCAHNTEKKFIEFENRKFVTQEKTIIFKFTINEKILNDTVHVDFATSTTSKISIESNEIHLIKNSGEIKVKIDDTVENNSSFIFDFHFVCETPKTTYDFTEYDFGIYYIITEPTELDDLYFPIRNCSITDKHIFTYEIQFWALPQSKKIHIDFHSISEELTLPQSDIELVGSSPYKLIIPIELSMSVFQWSSYYFDLTLSFTNSYGKDQTTSFYGCTAQYSKTESEDVPLDYFDLEEIPNSNNVSDEQYYRLKGLKPGVNPVEGGHYRNLIIPENVIEIDNEAFIDTKWFSGIRLLKLSKTIQTLGTKCFYGLTNLIEIDLMDYDEEPLWKDVSDIFDGNSMSYNFGYVWTNNCDPLHSLNDQLKSWGLPSNWSAFDKVNIADPSWFDIQNKNQLVGILPEHIDDVARCQVIKIPEQITEIDNEPFVQLQNRPFLYQDESGVHKKTRRLVFNRKLSQFSPKAFMGCGFGGPILFISEFIHTIPNSCFNNLNYFGSTPSFDVEVESTSLHVLDTLSLNEIQDYAFNNVPLNDDVFDIPISVMNIGSFAFQGHNFKKIIMYNKLESVGDYAFAKSYAYPSTPTLTELDLSKYETVAPWMSDSICVFDGACASSGTILFNEKIKSSMGKTDDEIENWIKIFKIRQCIPNNDNWKIKWIS